MFKIELREWDRFYRVLSEMVALILKGIHNFHEHIHMFENNNAFVLLLE